SLARKSIAVSQAIPTCSSIALADTFHYHINYIMSDPFMKLRSFVESLLILCELLVLAFP
ncbi:hypothetical protein V7159_24330, partial [Priestia megaterium]|uniref:hypothetical protein n=1 Tax=Priestia megaterium TaxID=1404 RepID=UPI0030099F5D